MEFLIYAIAFVIGVGLNTAVLAGSLFLVEDINSSSFKELGVLPTLARCAAISVAVNLVGLIPFPILALFLLMLIVWFLGIMVLFQKTFGQTLILFLINALFGCGIMGAINHVLSRLLDAD